MKGWKSEWETLGDIFKSSFFMSTKLKMRLETNKKIRLSFQAVSGNFPLKYIILENITMS